MALWKSAERYRQPPLPAPRLVRKRAVDGDDRARHFSLNSANADACDRRDLGVAEIVQAMS